jgi:hypothetical protein
MCNAAGRVGWMCGRIWVMLACGKIFSEIILKWPILEDIIKADITNLWLQVRIYSSDCGWGLSSDYNYFSSHVSGFHSNVPLTSWVHISFSNGLRPGRSGLPIPAGGRDVFFCEKPRPVLRPTQPPLLGAKRSERDVDHLPVSNTDVQRGGNCTLLHLYAVIVWTGTMCIYLFFLMETCGYEFYCIFKTEGGTRDATQTRYWGFHFLPDFLSVFPLSSISAPLTGYTEFFSVGPRARYWESCWIVRLPLQFPFCSCSSKSFWCTCGG